MASTSKKTKEPMETVEIDDDDEFDTNWDIDAYRKDFENEEHWSLKSQFMKAHKDKFPEDRLVCLSEVFTNIEFMGCKYHSELMLQVAELSKEVAKDFRSQRALKIKPTFVAASDAAEQRAKGRRSAQAAWNDASGTSAGKHRRMDSDAAGGSWQQYPQQNYNQRQQPYQRQQNYQQQQQQQYQRQPPYYQQQQQNNWQQSYQQQQQQPYNQRQQNYQQQNQYQQRQQPYQQQYQQRQQPYQQQQQQQQFQQNQRPYQQQQQRQQSYQNQEQNGPSNPKRNFGGGGELFDGLRFGNFVLFLAGGRNCIRTSAQRCNMEYQEKEIDGATDKKKVEIYLNDKLITSGLESNMKTSKLEAFWNAIEILQSNCYSIKRNPQRDTIKVDKSNNQVVCDVIQQQGDELEEKKLDANNKGFKMMKSMGWAGGGLGSKTQGREEPVGYLFKNNRAGLGNDECKLDRKYFTQMLQNYLNSEDIRELQFESTFTKDERAMLHEIAAKFNLRSNSSGRNDDRRLIISKKGISNEKILKEILLRRNNIYADQYFVQVPESRTKQYPDHTAKLELDM